ncbi:MAG: hypothetical protein WA979_08890 [Pacificimonas sp.]
MSLAASVFLASTAFAQVDFGDPGWGPSMEVVNDVVNDAIISDILGDVATKRAPRRDNGAPIFTQKKGGLMASLTGASGLSSQSSPYAYSPRGGTDAKGAFLARLEKSDPQAAATVALSLGNHDVVKIYEGIVSPFGLTSRDAADSMTAYTVLGWMIANSAGDPGRDSVLAARAQVIQQLQQSGAIPAGKSQEMDEELMHLFVIMHAGWQSSMKEGGQARRAYADGINTMWRNKFGKDLRSLNLTREGFRDRG